VNNEQGGASSPKARRFGRWDYFKITILVFATTALWQGMHGIILPLRVLDFVPEVEKNTALGLLISTGLLLAMIVQPVVGAISDRSGFSWGRRRPFILVGIVFLLLLLPGIGLAGSYAVLFTTYCFLQIGSNTVQGPHQGFIPDLVPVGKRGLASGVKGLLEILGGVALLYPIAIFMDNYAIGQGNQWLWLSLALPGIVLLLFTVVTVLKVREQPRSGGLQLSAANLNASIIKRHLLIWLRLSPVIGFIKRHRSFAWFLASRLFFFLAMAVIQRFALYYLRDIIGAEDPAEAVFRFSILAVIGMLVVVYPAGRLSDRMGRKSIAFSSAILGSLGILLIILYQSYASIMIAAGILGVATGAFTATNWALATDLVVNGKEARYLGLANMATAGAGVLAGAVGPLIDRYEAVTIGLGYQIMLVACLLFFLLGGLLLLKVRSPIIQQNHVPNLGP
jgi:Na+/melibiose symporter-like transporter